MTQTPDVEAAVERHVRLSETPFDEGGLGAEMFVQFHAYLNEYVLSTDGADYEPNDFERALIEDFFGGLMDDEYLFGPIRTILASHAALVERSPPPPSVSRDDVFQAVMLGGDAFGITDRVMALCSRPPAVSVEEVARVIRENVMVDATQGEGVMAPIPFPTNRTRAACYACFDFETGTRNECPVCGRGIAGRLPFEQRPARPPMFKDNRP